MVQKNRQSIEPKTLLSSLKGQPCKDAFNIVLFDIFVLNIDWEIDQQKCQSNLSLMPVKKK